MPTRLVTDASDIAAGAALEQWINNSWRPIGFYSKLFAKSELNYSAYDRELLAVKLGLQTFRHIVEAIPGDIFHVATDHKPLTTGKQFQATQSNKTQRSRNERTWQFISELTTDIRHISGEKNPVADALSRNAVNFNQYNFDGLLRQIAEEQRKCGMRPDTGESWPDHWKLHNHGETSIVVDIRAEMPRPVVPEKLQRKVFSAIHDLGHLGIKATRKAISDSFVWHTMSKDIANWVSECQGCQASKVFRHNKSELQRFPNSSGKFHIHIDIVGPLPQSNGFSYILTVVDRFSRWPAAIPLQGITAQQCAEALVHGWIQNYGTPISIVTDRGRQFTSALWSELCQVLGTTHGTTTAYHPQANGLVERFHRQFKASLMAQAGRTEDWFQSLPLVMLAIRTAIKEDLQVSAAQIVYGEKLRLPGAFFPTTTTQSQLGSYAQTLEKCMHDLEYIQPQWHNKNTSNSIKDLKDCTHVFVRVDGVKAPLQQPYKGPYRVVKKYDKSFVIELPNGSTNTVSIDRLKPAKTF